MLSINNNKHPHDRFFKKAMADKRVARDFFEAHLPENILALVDLNYLEQKASNFVDDLGKESISDVLYQTKIADREAYFYLLVDHQSTPDELMPFRILKYACNIIDQHLSSTSKKRLPMIFPLVVYHGKRPWHYSTNINDLVDFPKELVDAYFLKPFSLIDLNKIDDEVLKEHIWAAAMSLPLKHIFKKDMNSFVLVIMQILRKLEPLDGRNLIETVVCYILGYGELNNKEAFFKRIQTELSSEIGETVMTIAEQLRLEGERKGEIKGEIKGRIESTIKMAERLLSEGAELAFIARITELPLEKIKELQTQAN